MESACKSFVGFYQGIKGELSGVEREEMDPAHQTLVKECCTLSDFGLCPILGEAPGKQHILVYNPSLKRDSPHRPIVISCPLFLSLSFSVIPFYTNGKGTLPWVFCSTGSETFRDAGVLAWCEGV